ncbi:MAG: glycine betaine ABC transporter substrate-binding protein [Woeseia sp.]
MTMRLLLVALLATADLAGTAAFARPMVIGSKNFTENYILAEIAAQLLENSGIDVERRLGLNGTKISFEALANNAVDLYPEYSGTISEVILADPRLGNWKDIESALSERGFMLLAPLGFNNTYAIAVTAAVGLEYDLQNISELKELPHLRVAFPHEFLNRQDGWPGLKAVYALPQAVRGIEHGLIYEAMANDQIDATAVYSTDGEISRSGLVILRDDLKLRPPPLPSRLRRCPATADSCGARKPPDC